MLGLRLRRFGVQLAGLTLGVMLSAFSVAAAEPEFAHGKWPFCPPTRPDLPAVQDASWIANPIDAFVLAALEQAGLKPSARADKLALLRRVTFDLAGLPPTLDEQQAFLADASDGAYQRVVERLLASPHYGERWAQHWLDVVRYAETDGFKEDAFRPNAHKYRDYVIRAFNADLPYDRFIRQQLAGDELEPDNPEALLATGLNRLYPDEYNAADVRRRRQEIHDDLTETTGLAFLGLTVGCAQCHDHKFDPIAQADYYRLQACFAGMLPRDDMPLATSDERGRHEAAQAAWEEATRSIRDEIEAILAPHREASIKDALQKFEPDVRQAVEKPPSERSVLDEQICVQAMKYVTPKLREIAKELKGDEKQRYESLRAELARFDDLKPPALPTAMTISDGAVLAPATFRLVLGNYRKPLEQVQPGFPAFLGASDPERVPLADGVQSSGRRAALAAWLTRSDHPLTARVIVNRLWQHHFGLGIVATPNDFGAMGEPASHPELLDWLAVELVEQGWSLKAMHRLMVTSAAYRQSSLVDLDNPAHAAALERDAGNRLLWHARRRRLEGEAIRDAMLQVAGRLNGRMYGPSARPDLPEGVKAKPAWEVDKHPADRDRRSVYIFAKRNLRYPLLELFDLPDMHASCPQRSATTTAPQALALLNSAFTLGQARHWAGRLLSEHASDEALVRSAIAEALARAASDEEAGEACAFIARQSAANKSEATRETSLPIPLPPDVDTARAAAVVDFCHALANANEFLYVD